MGSKWLQIHPKVAGSAIFLYIGGIIVAELQRHGITLTGDEVSDIMGLCAILGGYLAPSGANDGSGNGNPLTRSISTTG